MKTYIGIDNGVTGSITVINDDYISVEPMPCKTEQSYTKARQEITRIDVPVLKTMLSRIFLPCLVLLERPMVMPARFKQTMSAIRALEAVLICIEAWKLPVRYIDSKEWQREMLPQGTEKKELKKVSLQIGMRLFPGVNWKGFKDADSLLMAEWARRNQL